MGKVQSGGGEQRAPVGQQTIVLTPVPVPSSSGRPCWPSHCPRSRVWPAPHPSPLTSLALAGRVQVVVGAQQLALAVGPTVIHARGQEGAQAHFSRCVAAPHKPVDTRSWLFEARATPTQLQLCPKLFLLTEAPPRRESGGSGTRSPSVGTEFEAWPLWTRH